ncbi:MAG: MerR family transcriptional regulator [Rhodospirillales bacterium]|nr:MerR family transcriptional regulator [Rhodospirillales bacterium]
MATASAAGRRLEKSSSAFRTISEVAQDLDVPQHVLRFWETRFTQIRPLKRGGGRRYYRPEDVALLRLIRELLYDEGYTIKGVQKLMREGALKQRLAQLEAEQLAEQASPAMEAPGASPADPLRQQLHSILIELESLRDRLRAALS